MTHYPIPETLAALLPEGWTIEDLPRSRTSVVAGAGGFVSISWNVRRFELGYHCHVSGRPYPPYEYSGRGWQDRLLADAIAALKKVYE